MGIGSSLPSGVALTPRRISDATGITTRFTGEKPVVQSLPGAIRPSTTAVTAYDSPLTRKPAAIAARPPPPLGFFSSRPHEAPRGGRVSSPDEHEERASAEANASTGVARSQACRKEANQSMSKGHAYRDILASERQSAHSTEASDARATTPAARSRRARPSGTTRARTNPAQSPSATSAWLPDNAGFGAVNA